METSRIGITNLSFNVFKIDLIVWKLKTVILTYAYSSKFKIDLIVWKHFLQLTSPNIPSTFKIDLIVWKPNSTSDKYHQSISLK